MHQPISADVAGFLPRPWRDLLCFASGRELGSEALKSYVTLRRHGWGYGGVLTLNERVSGAVEALAWFEELLERAAVKGRSISDVRDEVERLREELLRGVAVDFERRVFKW